MAYTTIKKPSDYFDGKTYLGSASAVTVTGLNFQPDLVWVKDRDNGNNHCLVDAVRGAGKYMSSDLGSAETNNATNSISTFNSDGFTTGTANPANEAASTTKGFMSWNWLASNTTASNTDGSITSTVSANTTSGFSIVSYTGTGANATVGHGLSAVPKMIIVKNRDQNDDWYVYHVSRGATQHIILNSSGTGGTNSTLWQDTEPTSSFFSIGTNNVVNTSGEDYIAYCFADVKGFSKIGSYVGNGNADGTFVYTGFKPAFILMKNASNATENWTMFDTKRDIFNVSYKGLLPNSSSVELTNTAQGMDILSNGFKPRAVEYRFNEPNANIIYMAIAEEPLVGDNPATAR